MKNLFDLEREKVELRGQTDHVVEALRKAKVNLEAAAKELNELKEKTLPKALADFALGKITRSELQKIKKKIVGFEEVIADHPSLIRGLEAENIRIGVGMRNREWSETNLRKYQALKTELREKGFCSDLGNSLLGLSHELNCVDEARGFLEELKALKNG